MNPDAGTETDLRTFRDFLMQYNLVTENCFMACVQDFTSRNVSDKEEKCAKNCLNKFLKMTQRLSLRFQEHQLIQAEAQGATMGRKSLALLCEAILEDYFGFYAAAVGRVLLKGACTFRELHKQLHATCKGIDLKKALCTLEVHGLVTFSAGNRGPVYAIQPAVVLHFLCFPRLLQIFDQNFSKLDTQLMALFFLEGRLSYQQCVDKILNEHNPQRKLSDQDVCSAFTNLVRAEALIKADFVVAGENEEVPVLTAHQHPLAFKPPEVPVPTEENPQKRKLPAESPDEHWIANWTGLQKLMRDEAVLECIQVHPEYKPQHEALWRILLKIASPPSEITAMRSEPVSTQQVIGRFKEEQGKLLSWPEVNDVFTPLTKQRETFPSYPPFICKLGDTAGGLYTIAYQEAFAAMCYENVEAVLRERIDDRAVRLFRLIYHYQNVEEEQLSKMAMLSTKEAKAICHLMMESGYIYLRPVAKSNDFAPSRTYYLYTHKLTDLINIMLSLNYDSLRNVIRRRLQEVQAKNVLIEMRRKIDTIIANIRSDETIGEEDKKAQAEEVESMYMTEEDARHFQRHLFGQRRMVATELALERSLFVFQMCNQYDVTRSLEFAAAKGPKKRKTQLEI